MDSQREMGPRGPCGAKPGEHRGKRRAKGKIRGQDDKEKRERRERNMKKKRQRQQRNTKDSMIRAACFRNQGEKKQRLDWN